MSSLWIARQEVLEASEIFLFNQTPTAERIQNSLSTLTECLKWARQHTVVELENEALWGISLCQNRLEKPSLAADALLQMRNNLEHTRTGIKDPLKRGGVFQSFPELFNLLCKNLSLAGRTEELLESVEASKGRGVADILTQKTDHVVADTSINSSAKLVASLTKRHKFHYLSYYVDREGTYGVLVTKDGDSYSIGPIGISKSKIREATQHVDPRDWGKPADYDASIMIDDVSEVLSPLVEPLEGFLENEIMKIGDHICWSPDDNFHNVPLHYLWFRGKRLIDFFSVSKIHNASHLQHILTKTHVPRPDSFVAVIVPSKQDVQGTHSRKFKENLKRPGKRLGNYMIGSVVENKTASLENVLSWKLTNKLMHFSTHGIFPKAQEKQNPFTQSGLILSDCQGLPDQDTVDSGNRDNVLTPSKILENALEYKDCHISMMACVSGLSREGLDGDALGMDWAFIQAGATSLLSSHWYISAQSAAGFFERFYDEWLQKKKSRGQAFSETIRHLRTKHDRPDALWSWAGFSLTGDWR